MSAEDTFALRCRLDEAIGRAERAERALEEACKMDTIRLKLGELTAKEQQLASIVAGLIHGSVVAALTQPDAAEKAER